MGNLPPFQKTIFVDEGFIGFFSLTQDSALPRLYTVVFVSWIVSWYTYVLLEIEWRDLLALRRVYFLEADHWSDRNAELEETLLREEREKEQGIVDVESGTNYSKTREPWAHHPEQRDTVPNIELYSVLVGGLPSLPTEAFLQEDVKAAFSQKQSIDWQLAVTSAFFDHCVPNQPGFSSSVAAVTIIPAATQITEAWKQWYKTDAKVRRLRFIRKELGKRKKEMNICEIKEDNMKTKEAQRKRKKIKSSIYNESEEKKNYYDEVLGTTDDLNVANNLLQVLNLGPEQTAVYSREFAESANIAPHGWNEWRVRNSSLEELIKMEKHAINAVQEASQALRKAQERIAGNDTLSNDGDLTELMATTSITPSFESSQHHERMIDIDEKISLVDRFKHSSIGKRWLHFTKKKRPMTDTKGDDDYSKSDIPINNDSAYNAADESSRSMTQNPESVDQVAYQSNGRSTKEKESTAQNATLGEQKSFTKNVRSEVRRFTPGLDDLCLEAGLFLEQKNLSIGFSQQMPRNSLPRPKTTGDIPEPQIDKRDKSLLASTQDDKRHNHHSIPRHVRSTDDTYTLQKSLEVEDYSESDIDHFDVGSSSLSQDISEGAETSAMVHSPFITSEEDERDRLRRERLGCEPNEPVCAEGKMETNMDSHLSSIWDKISSEHDRRIQIRNRLATVRKSSIEGKLVETRTESVPDVEEQGEIDENSTISSSLNPVSISKADNALRRADIQKHSMQKLNSTSTRLFSIYESNDSKDSVEFNATQASKRDLLFNIIDQDQNTQLAYGFEEKVGLRRRQANTAVDRLNQTMNEKWSKVIQIANESSSRRDKDGKVDPILSGSYSESSVFESMMTMLKNACNISTWQRRSTDIDSFNLVGESTFAVVTFTSRQAAVAARHCLADSRGADRWNPVKDLPSPPLADAPVCNLLSCARPVTLSINVQQKMIRHTLKIVILGAIYMFYISPLKFVLNSLTPDNLVEIAPGMELWVKHDFAKYIFSGFIPALVFSVLYGICPPMFKVIANLGSNATSAACAEGSAIRYFWWFMIVSAFTATSLIGFKSDDLSLGHNVRDAIFRIARTIPTTVSATWLNWIIVRGLLVLPTQYILQMNAFLLSWLGIKSLARVAQGGGSGGPIPFRLYVDSGVVMLCLLVLAPASPLIAPAALVYFLFSVPMLRWVLIFLYKPKFDVGGARYPFIFDMCVSGMVAGQSVLGTMILIRGAAVPAVMAFLPLFPIIFYRSMLLKRYLRPFTDVTLLQTSLLDGWDSREGGCTSKREEFRQFLVDCHKAAYVPVCIACDESIAITSEPAVVVPLDTDCDEDDDDMVSINTGCASANDEDNESVHESKPKQERRSSLYHPYEPHKQPGRMMRRTSCEMSARFLSASTRSLSTPIRSHPLSPGGFVSPYKECYDARPTIQKRFIRSKTTNQSMPNAPLDV